MGQFFVKRKVCKLLKNDAHKQLKFQLPVRLVFVFCFLFFFVLSASAQTTIWSENFNSYSDLTNTGAGSPAGVTSWTADGANPNLYGVTVFNQKLEGYRTRTPNPDLDTWEIDAANPIEIGSYSNVSISVNISEAGNLENTDYIQVQYKIDGGTWTNFTTNGYLNNDFGSAVASVSGLSGTNLWLRIIMSNNGNNEFYSADDILVEGTLVGIACTTPISPLDNATNVSANTALTWNAASGATGYYLHFGTDAAATNIENGTDLGNVTSYTPAASLSSGTDYYWEVVPYNATDDAYPCDIWSFTTGANYCSSSGTMDFADGITLVNFNTINNATGKPAGYNDYTSLSTDLTIGNTYALTVNLNTDGNFTNYAKVWIDWNQNNSFADPGEEYDLGTVTNNPDGATSLSPLDITVPATAQLGTTRMRVVTKYAAEPTACEEGFDGETEDYSLSICGGPSISVQPSTAGENLCVGENATALSITASGTALTYQWYSNATASNTGGTLIAGATAASYTPLTTTAGTLYYYCIVSSSGGGCSGSTTSNVSGAITVNALPTASISISETSGTTDNDGILCAGDSATLTASGGTSYSWSSGETTASISKAAAGTYVVSVTDGNGCVAKDSVAITEIPLPNNTSSGFTGNTICLGNNGVITFNAINSSFVTPYLIEYTDGTTTWTQVISTAAATSFNVAVNPITTTNYSLVSITNGNGCTRTSGFGDATAQITVNSLPTASISISETSGTTNNDGILCAGDSATLTASGGTSYSWSSGESTASISKAAAGTYVVTVTDGNGCVAKDSVTITVNALPTASISISETSGTTNNDGIICAGESATLTASGGTSYSWSSGESTASISKATAGTYVVTVTDGNGCVAKDSVTITVNSLPTASISISETSGTTNNDGIICAGDSATLTASGGTSYSWSSGESTASISKATAGTYVVTVTDGNGCVAKDSVTITVNALPTASISISETSGTTNNDGILCSGDSATLTASGGTSYSWISGESTASISKATAGTYVVTVTDGNGCLDTASVTLVENPLPTITLSNASAEVCKGDTVASITYSATTETPDTYSINFDATAEGQGFVDVTDATLPAGEIEIVVPAGAVADTYNATITVKNGTTACGSTAYNVNIIVHPLPNTTSIQTN